MSQASKAKAAIEKIRASVTGAADVSTKSLENTDISDK